MDRSCEISALSFSAGSLGSALFLFGLGIATWRLISLHFKMGFGSSLAVQWLGLYVPNAGGMSSIPGRGTKILHAAQRGLNK